jgi:(2Fe-2S) ferredoxin
MTTSVTVCNGCCCGRVDKGHNEVPIDFLKTQWKENNIGEHVKLTISGCLGPCSMHNVTLLSTQDGRIWLGELNNQSHYEAIVEWAQDIGHNGKDAVFPEILTSHRFKPKKSTTVDPTIF